MRWVLGVVGLLVLVVVVVVAVGYTLPQSHVASSSARYRASPEAVWASLTDVAAYPTWRTGVTRVELLPGENGQTEWREYGSETITFRIVEKDPPRRLVTRIADEGLPFGGRWIYELAPLDSGTRLTITEQGEIYNPVFRFVSRFVLGYTSTMDDVLRALGTKHGEVVTPEPGRAPNNSASSSATT